MQFGDCLGLLEHIEIGRELFVILVARADLRGNGIAPSLAWPHP
jgi:hypothetical protein